MSHDPTNEVRFLKIELNNETTQGRLNKVEERVEVLENEHFDQVKVLDKLSTTVSILSQTVSTLSDLTKELDKGQEVFKARFNIIIGILSTIGIAVIGAAIKIIFFPGIGG